MDDVIQVAPTGWEEPLLDHIFTQLCLPDSSAQASATALFRALLCHWTAAHAANGPSSNAAKELVRKAAERYNAFRMESMNLDNLAAELGVGSRRLRQAFAQELGISPKRYFTTVRLRQAAQALKMGRGNVTQIAEQVGYASPFHFSRAFKAEFGCSPSDYVQARQTRAKGG